MRLAIIVVFLGACGHSHMGEHAAPDAPAGGSSDASTDGACGAEHLGATYIAPNLMLALDRSCSMTKLLTGTTTSKWQAAVAALSDALGTYGTEIRWGATLFPDTTGDSCTQDAPAVPVGDNNAPTIDTMLNAALDPANPLYPDGPCVTNLDTGVEQAAADPALADPTHAGYVMLVTDGAQYGCSAGGGNSGTEAAVQTLHDHGVTTFVVGFGSQVNATELDKLAALGGAALPGPTQYYQADTAADLDQAFQTIGSLVVSCSYQLNPPPPDIDELYVYLDHNAIPRDPGHQDGWDYDPATQTLTLYGAPCDALEHHQASGFDVVFGCPIQ